MSIASGLLTPKRKKIDVKPAVTFFLIILRSILLVSELRIVIDEMLFFNLR